MRPTIHRMWDALCCGRPAQDVAAHLGIGLVALIGLWGCAVVFLMMEPLA